MSLACQSCGPLSNTEGRCHTQLLSTTQINSTKQIVRPSSVNGHLRAQSLSTTPTNNVHPFRNLIARNPAQVDILHTDPWYNTVLTNASSTILPPQLYHRHTKRLVLQSSQNTATGRKPNRLWSGPTNAIARSTPGQSDQKHCISVHIFIMKLTCDHQCHVI